ncbi:hypothetical protein KAFR_0C02810 [Kazachstania africana CBS 2517]|uniref:DNA-(apurinic or apyrimidinic site) endonuclease 2 n=1 Tax=Kazachstania africana (strain ATCC 22294 / BCRC 22015 / CBS 2517 / CECT 1963 / NBRC 1671 / NRRL Y-8276) TaxID=1071382 RepID=H2ASC4_KAZAF|nr:hypothetical protein KAFR_0C02810 [Kazachstania africana CBS 2517]CCF57274.1 hypothetical protein KAFR_0C02810 [Kazachstania africana CBS 2517]
MAQCTDIPDKQDNDNVLRLVTFNVNAIGTFFHYDPFSRMNNSLLDVFDYLKADIITFQEMKIDQRSITKWGKINSFYSFISIPRSKKGYSGVGCWIRIPPEDHPLHHKLKVLKAEEGITGALSVKISRDKTVKYRDDPTVGIGGYEMIDENEALHIDSEGRCVMVELACNLVVISVYCPANSGLTDEGELFRLKFLRLLFKRVRNLEALGKRTVLMGDLNVCRDLIDQAAGLEDSSIKLGPTDTGSAIEKQYPLEAKEFIMNPDVPHRRLMNHMLTDSIIPELAKDGILVDSTRYIQGRERLKMYTVWNSLKNYRPNNFGSRVDFILISDHIKKLLVDGNILPDVMGSDHCPIYADLDISSLNSSCGPSGNVNIPKFECRYKYDLLNHNVLAMFSKMSSTHSSENLALSKKVTKPRKVPRSKSIDKFFERSIPDSSVIDKPTIHEEVIQPPKPLTTSKVKRETLSFKDIFGKPPLCKHGEEAILKTSRTAANPGKRFWACHRPQGDSNNKGGSCGFFQWV